MPPLQLPTVTLCAASSVNIAATVAALEACMDQVQFADCLLFTDAPLADLNPAIRAVPIAGLVSAEDYSAFVLKDLASHIATDHCLIVQWDGFVLDAACWSSDFLTFDYIGAPWPQFDDGMEVGNGGFSLRTRRLLEACRDPDFLSHHPEDVAICRTNRRLLELRYGLRFADRGAAERFAFERGSPKGPTFGFHGIFNMIPLLGADQFWAIYHALDDRRTAFDDFWRLMKQLGGSQNSLRRRLRLILDWTRSVAPGSNMSG